jgi:hypothetical protein
MEGRLERLVRVAANPAQILAGARCVPSDSGEERSEWGRRCWRILQSHFQPQEAASFEAWQQHAQEAPSFEAWQQNALDSQSDLNMS